MNNRFFAVLLMAGLAVYISQCATPTQPTGGPRDRTPPRVVETYPATGTTQFDGDRIEMEFSKYINRNSFRDALQIEPDLGIPYDISWRRRTARVEFEEALPENTTIIFTVGTDLRDTEGNAIHGPFQLALSTGPDIDSGRIQASVKNAETGKGKRGERVVLYRYPYNLEEPADYVAESDSSGTVRFNYLREGEYFMFWLDDRNRNRTWDPPRERAQPFWSDRVFLDPEGETDAGTVYITRIDTIAPSLLAVGMLSEVRMRLRFSKQIRITDASRIYIQDETGSEITEAIPLYVDSENDNILYAESEIPLPDQQDYAIKLSEIRDSAGNRAEVGLDVFPGSDEPDTTLARYIDHDTRRGVAPDEPLRFRYARILDRDNDVRILDSLIVIQSQETIEPGELTRMEKQFLYVYPPEEWRRGESYEIRVWDDDLMNHHPVEPTILYPDDTGSIIIQAVEEDKTTAEMYAELINEHGELIHSSRFTNEIEFDRVQTGTWLLRAYEIREGVEGWDPGRVAPFRPPARFFIQDGIMVERGMAGSVYLEWETEDDEAEE
ncbi:Ig-like domain-containing protein [Balneolaceae bacterium ANBcel3]|nr:Ig-like domain-containing protein [Balneolaceae bacterium ANBcel3]